ncbi:MAG: RDD family protein [Candidatus Goldbacteria bacterium]|nr:RDD family protein [Candidatus Goldiibacteriota bacterium]
MVMKIEVVGKTGTSISVIRASIRAAVITLPFFLNNMSLPYDLAMNPVFMTLISIVIFGGMFTVLYFFTVNRATKQSIHDVITETYVVNSQSAVKTVEGKIQLYKYAILGVLLIAIFHFGLNALNRLSQKVEMTEMTKLMQIIAAKSDLYVTGVQENTTTVTGVLNSDSSKVNSLIVSGMPKEPKDNYNESAVKIVKIVRDNYNLNGIDKITIKFNVGYDIGISSSWKTVNISEDVKK